MKISDKMQEQLTSLEKQHIPKAEILKRKFLKRSIIAALAQAKKAWTLDIPLPPQDCNWNDEPMTYIEFNWEDDDLHVRETFTFTDDTYYYDLMGFAGSCKDPFCDLECPLHLETKGDTPMVKWVSKAKSGVVVADIEVWSPLPEKIEQHLRNKGIIVKEHYSYTGSSGVNTNIVCPTQEA